MNPLLRYFFLVFLILPGLTTAAANTVTLNKVAEKPEMSIIETLDKVMLEIEAEEYSPYSVEQCEDEDDEDKLPENVVEIMYGNGRMAFLFGQFEIAYKAWVPLADQGYAKAQASLAWMYHTGNGVDKNMKQAKKLYKLAAEQGHNIAQNNLAVIYENGLGGAVDEKTAFKWYKKSADSGYYYAQYNLGRMYAEGRGTSRNMKEAAYWWRSAARHKVKKAIEALALLEKKSAPKTHSSSPKHSVAHAPYHGNPVAKGLDWLKKQAVNHYTIQLTRSQDMKWILDVAATEQLSETIVHFQSTNAQGNKWYTLVYGSFPSFQSAEIARKALPDSLKKWSPKLRRFGEIHQLIKK